METAMIWRCVLYFSSCYWFSIKNSTQLYIKLWLSQVSTKCIYIYHSGMVWSNFHRKNLVVVGCCCYYCCWSLRHHWKFNWNSIQSRYLSFSVYLIWFFFCFVWCLSSSVYVWMMWYFCVVWGISYFIRSVVGWVHCDCIYFTWYIYKLLNLQREISIPQWYDVTVEVDSYITAAVSFHVMSHRRVKFDFQYSNIQHSYDVPKSFDFQKTRKWIFIGMENL